ncbi:carbamoyl phosphate synthetase [Mucilaginibacter pedocola]|uniref:Carbamoyl phosphate synthetase n=2 Tax=Mucilaginibacter pedocola TaxID=1792845 RepID=A0A1S9PLY1_9SPHI|nr:carbamoyl phosphate synthetase [Mucilaginibacter pedocola]
MKNQQVKIATDWKSVSMRMIMLFSALFLGLPLYAQDGNAGIQEATTQVKSYFETGTSLMYAIGAIVGLVGAIKVYKKWNDGEHDTGKVASSWFGSCIFLVVVATVLKSFFGV